MPDDIPPVPVHFRWWRVLGWALLAALLATVGWNVWRGYDYRATVREARAAGCLFQESPTPFARIRYDWRNAFRLAIWAEHQRVLYLPEGTDLAPLRPLLRRLDPTDMASARSRNVDALRGLARLHWLDLTDSDLQDLTPLTGLTQLQYLNLRGCTGVKDLTPLAGLTHLQLLDLSSRTGLSAEAVTAFKKSHPQVKVSRP